MILNYVRSALLGFLCATVVWLLYEVAFVRRTEFDPAGQLLTLGVVAIVGMMIGCAAAFGAHLLARQRHRRWIAYKTSAMYKYRRHLRS
jgi:hypothetical protein